jgi:transposase
VLARAHQDATWRRTRAGNELRSLLREYFPGFLHAFAERPGGISAPEARAVLAIAPTPAKAARLSKPQIAAARAGRQRGLTALADTIHQQLRLPQLRHPTLVEDAFGIQAVAVLATLDAECASVDRLGEATVAAFTQHPDHRIITSFVGLADLTGARLLAEIGDDRTRFVDARALKAFAGSAPITKASGRSIRITHRHVKNNRLAAVGFVWAFIAAGCQGPTRAHYLARRDHGDRHPAALRHLYNRMLGHLYHCLQTDQTYDPIKAYGPTPTHPTRAAA